MTALNQGKTIEAGAYESDAAAVKIDRAAYEHVLRLSEAIGVESALPRHIADITARACEAG